MKKIAIIDDDIYIGDMLQEVLRREGYGVLRAYSGTEALYLLEKEQPDLVLLDLMLPGLSGEEVLPKIKDLPVIVVSAKVDVDDKVNLLLSGACDYVTKPFEIKELLARIDVQLRMRQSQSPWQKQRGGSAAAGSESVLQCGDLTLDESARAVTVCGIPVKVTKTEFAILKLLMQNAGRAIAKSVILDRISPDTPDCTESSLKIHVSNLRKKLKEAGGRDYIQAVWGIGFKLASSEDGEA